MDFLYLGQIYQRGDIQNELSVYLSNRGRCLVWNSIGFILIFHLLLPLQISSLFRMTSIVQKLTYCALAINTDINEIEKNSNEGNISLI